MGTAARRQFSLDAFGHDAVISHDQGAEAEEEAAAAAEAAAEAAAAAAAAAKAAAKTKKTVAPPALAAAAAVTSLPTAIRNSMRELPKPLRHLLAGAFSGGAFRSSLPLCPKPQQRPPSRRIPTPRGVLSITARSLRPPASVPSFRCRKRYPFIALLVYPSSLPQASPKPRRPRWRLSACG